MENNNEYHIPVLCDEIMGYFSKIKSGTIVDGTLGGGGHSNAILSQFDKLNVIGFDKDSVAIEYATKRLEEFSSRFAPINNGFEDIKSVLAEKNIDTVSGVLLDLGVSSRQIDNPEKGFSFSSGGPLDMRFSENSISAKTVVNEYSKDKLKEIIKKYGEEKHAHRIASAIADERENGEISTTTELAKIIESVCRYEVKSKARVFQAIRIEVNQELWALEKVLQDVPALLASGGYFAVISYHSLEDRLVKKAFRNISKYVDKGTFLLPGEKRVKPEILDCTRKPTLPTEKEIKYNSRARSAKLRVIQKI